MDQRKVSELEEVFRHFSRRIFQQWGKHLAGAMTPPQAAILEFLQTSGPHKVSDIAERMAMTPGAITGLSDKLIAGGYAKRIRSEQDRRVVNLEITPKGVAQLESIRTAKRKIVNQVFEGIPEEDVEHLIRIFRKLAHNTEK